MSLYYMECLHPARSWDDLGQKTRVIEFGRKFSKEIRERVRARGLLGRPPERADFRPWLLKQLFLILDETENQC